MDIAAAPAQTPEKGRTGKGCFATLLIIFLGS